MRSVFIDLSSDNYLQQPQIFGGYAGEHNETVLQVKLPDRMVRSEYTDYYFEFQTSEDNRIKSPPISKTQLNNGILSLHLTEQLTIAGKLKFNVGAISLNGGTISVNSKTNMIVLYIGDSPEGKSILPDPNGYKDEILEFIDARIDEALSNVQFGENGFIIVDQTYNPESENAQSGKAVAEAILSKIELWKPNTHYKVGDVVLGKWALDKGYFFEADVLATCKKEHTSSLRGTYLNAEDPTLWGDIQELTVENATNAENDMFGNQISSTYATKEALNNIISAGLKREIIEDFFPRFDDSDSNTIYMKKSDSGKVNNYYNEYLMIGLHSFDVISDISSICIMPNEIDVSDREIDFVGVSIDEVGLHSDYIDITVSGVNHASHKIRIGASNDELIQLIVNGGARYMSFDFVYKDNTLRDVRIYSTELIGSTAVDLTDYAKTSDLSKKEDKNKILDYITYEIIEDENNNKSITIKTCNTSISGNHIIPSLIEGYPVTNIDYEAFFNCTSLESVIVPDSVTSIGEEAFAYCEQLTHITLSNNITNVNNRVFSNCKSLESIIIPNSVVSIIDSAFLGCKKLKNVVIGNGITSIDYEAFGGCESLTNITIPDSVTSIGKYAFRDCTSLTSITIPDSVTSISYSTFYGCTSLTDIYYKGTEEQWNSIIIDSGNDLLSNAIIHYNQVSVTKEELNNAIGNINEVLESLV